MCMNFKLKGYSCFKDFCAAFHEDTFATDCLQHILSLLLSLDGSLVILLAIDGLHLRHILSLLSSLDGSLVISLAIDSLSRVWVFTDPDTAETDPYWLKSLISRPHVHRAVLHPLATILPPHAVPGNQLRKSVACSQAPVSVDFDTPEEHRQFRTSLTSTVPSSCEDMTGIGSMTEVEISVSPMPASRLSASLNSSMVALVRHAGMGLVTSTRNDHLREPFTDIKYGPCIVCKRKNTLGVIMIPWVASCNPVISHTSIGGVNLSAKHIACTMKMTQKSRVHPGPSTPELACNLERLFETAKAKVLLARESCACREMVQLQIDFQQYMVPNKQSNVVGDASSFNPSNQINKLVQSSPSHFSFLVAHMWISGAAMD
ncbi:hypothetical protein F4604DRAFT_1677457 [Suillus subluteus]|nr:hypothetical protein F4604DRAFT_1677457 [Suillus subluteus]